MQPNPTFTRLDKSFWANIRTISQEVGYTETPKSKSNETEGSKIKIPTENEVKQAFAAIQLNCKHLIDDQNELTTLGEQVFAYFRYRAEVLNQTVRPLLMNGTEAKTLYENLRPEPIEKPSTGKKKVKKQKRIKKKGKKKKTPAFFTLCINILIERNLRGLPCNFNPQELTTITKDSEPFRTLSRRVDGAFPKPVNPIAIWEIKEYYNTTTFGSRVADGIYETLLDGLELEELNQTLQQGQTDDPPHSIDHLLMVDAYDTWWIKGRSYLCRIIDLLHMGYVSEVLFGREIENRLPLIVASWVERYQQMYPPSQT